ncbi:hypothetical protein [uncultured Aquimarina sp.]|uniref:hypothetical protein n=1 Tax=uncultured Aquimarina sp. TaxID=575652 RepID=UPI00260CF1D4|nr:hypothetical protein [uncultured Aquimarina sp.]
MRNLLIILLAFFTIGMSFAQQIQYDVTAGNGNGLRLWSSDSYKIHMGNASEYQYGPVTDYSIKTNMNSTTGRGWTWGVNGVTPIAALNNQGDFQIGRNFRALGNITLDGNNVSLPLNGTANNSDNYVNKYDFRIRKSNNSFYIGLSNEFNVRKVYLQSGHVSSAYAHGTGSISLNPFGGNVGIGTTSPRTKLDVIGTIKSDKLLLADPNDTSDWNTLWESGFYQSYNAANVPEPNQWFWGINMNHSSNNPNYKYNGQIVVKNNSVHPKMYFRSTNKEGTGTWARVVHSIGNQYIEGALGIGTTTPDAKLAVNGNIHTKEVRVDLIGWADYVFKEDYKLPTLEQVEDHIATKGHLINIPSAAEVTKNGIQLGEMNAKLLEKIEELTLYTIAQEKKLQEQEERLKRLEALLVKK